MAYSIGYGIQRQELRQRSSGRLGWMTAGCFVLFLLGVQLFWAEGAAVLRQLLFPIQPETAVYLESMVGSIMDGASVSDAVTTFCREVIEGAGIP